MPNICPPPAPGPRICGPRICAPGPRTYGPSSPDLRPRPRTAPGGAPPDLRPAFSAARLPPSTGGITCPAGSRGMHVQTSISGRGRGFANDPTPPLDPPASRLPAYHRLRISLFRRFDVWTFPSVPPCLPPPFSVSAFGVSALSSGHLTCPGGAGLSVVDCRSSGTSRGGAASLICSAHRSSLIADSWSSRSRPEPNNRRPLKTACVRA